MAKNAKPQIKLYVPPADKAKVKQYVPPPIDVGLFYWDTRLTDREKTEITAWYRLLTPTGRKFVDILREEQRDETEFDCSGQDG